MNKKALAVVASTVFGASSVLAAAPASAGTVQSGAYYQSTGNLSCVGHVQGDGDGGTMYVEVMAGEIRPSDKHFRTYRVKTRVVAQERAYDGTWHSVATTGFFKGALGPATSDDTTNVSEVQWGGDTSPILPIEVAGYDDLFRVRVITQFFDDAGVRVKRLVTHQGRCRL
jgi:hypothetical protein